MRKFIIIGIAAIGLNWLAGCAERETRTTTTEETTIHRPVSTTTETTTVRPGY